MSNRFIGKLAGLMEKYGVQLPDFTNIDVLGHAIWNIMTRSDISLEVYDDQFPILAALLCGKLRDEPNTKAQTPLCARAD